MNCRHELLLVPEPGACARSVHTSTHTCAPSVVLWPGGLRPLAVVLRLYTHTL
jgi:hypothetical protein